MIGGTFVGLPGFHGSARLFEAMVASCPVGARFVPLELPSAEPATYGELEDAVLDLLPPGPLWLVAESFSGPLGVRLAARFPVAGLVLSASFVRSPLPRAARALPLRRLAGLRPPTAAIRWALTGGDDGLARSVLEEMDRLPVPVLRARLEALRTVDVTDALVQAPCPVLCLQATRDRVVPERCGREIEALRPDARRVGIDAPHLVLQAAPEAAWEAIVAFAGLSGSSP